MPKVSTFTPVGTISPSNMIPVLVPIGGGLYTDALAPAIFLNGSVSGTLTTDYVKMLGNDGHRYVVSIEMIGGVPALHIVSSSSPSTVVTVTGAVLADDYLGVAPSITPSGPAVARDKVTGVVWWFDGTSWSN